MHFLLLFCTACKTSSIKILVCASNRAGWELDPGGLSPNLVIQHARTRPLNCETWNFLCFYIFINMKLIWDLWCYCFSSCCIRVISWCESQKCMTKRNIRNVSCYCRRGNSSTPIFFRNQCFLPHQPVGLPFGKTFVWRPLVCATYKGGAWWKSKHCCDTSDKLFTTRKPVNKKNFIYETHHKCLVFLHLRVKRKRFVIPSWIPRFFTGAR